MSKKKKNQTDIQTTVNNAIHDPRVDELISKGHSASVALTAVMFGEKWKSPLNPLRNKEGEEE